MALLHDEHMLRGALQSLEELLLPVFILHESTVKATFNTACELLGGYQERKPGVLYESWVVLTPLGV